MSDVIILKKDESKEIWDKNYKGKSLRIFVSYSSNDRKVVGEIKNSIERFGLSVFLAHEDIIPSSDWQIEIINNFISSDWTDQESGMAVALDKFILPINVETVPYGFINRWHAFKFDISNLENSCLGVIKVIREISPFQDYLKDCMIASLELARSFYVANPISEELLKFQHFTSDQVNQIIRNAIRNNQFRMSSSGKKLINEIISKYKNDLDPSLLKIFESVKDQFTVAFELS